MIVECPHGQVNCTTCRSSALVRELLSLREVARCARILSDALDRKILGDDRRVPGAWWNLDNALRLVPVLDKGTE